MDIETSVNGKREQRIITKKRNGGEERSSCRLGWAGVVEMVETETIIDRRRKMGKRKEQKNGEKGLGKKKNVFHKMF